MAIYSWSTTAATNATADASINWAEGQAPSTVNDSARALMAAVKSWQLDLSGLTTGGSGDAFTLTPNQALPSYGSAAFGFFANRSNTGTSTLNVSGLGTRPLRLTTGVELTAGQIVAGGYYLAAYNSSASEFIFIGKFTVANAQMATMVNNTIKANISGSTATPSDVTIDSIINAASAASVALSKLPTQADGTFLGNVSGSSASPAAVTPTQILDKISSTQGTVLYRNASAWVALAVGTSGQYLQTQGAAANPIWSTVTVPTGLPTQTTHADKFLTTDGTNASWSSNSSVRARAAFSSGGSPTIDTGSVNIATITRDSAGVYSVAFTSSLASTNYQVFCSGFNNTYGAMVCAAKKTDKTTSGFKLYTAIHTFGDVNFDYAEIVVYGGF